jgi:hypothetical protein
MFDLFENFPFLVVMIFAILFRVLSARAKQQKKDNAPPRRPSGPFPERTGDHEDEDDVFFPGKSPFPADIFHDGPVLRKGGSALPPLEKTVIAGPVVTPGPARLPPEFAPLRPLPAARPPLAAEPPLAVQPAAALSPGLAAPVSAVPAYHEAGGSGRGEPFPGSLDYLPPLKRALVFSEIFGPPKGFNP